MKILLDTHAFLWFIAGDAQLAPRSLQLIQDTQNERFLSIASVWEITIKSSLGRLTVPMPPSVLIQDHVWSNAIELLPILPPHLDFLHTLPFHHKDPFDRIMIAQAMSEQMTLISADREFGAYDIQVAWSSS